MGPSPTLLPLKTMKSKIHELLRRAKRESDPVRKCSYNCFVYQGDAKPEEMFTSWIVRNDSRPGPPGYERLQTTPPLLDVAKP